jgi:hypothetical protein
MNRQTAINRVASILAHNSFTHIEAAKEIPSLAENTAETLDKNLEAAKALQMDHIYLARLATLTK